MEEKRHEIIEVEAAVIEPEVLDAQGRPVGETPRAEEAPAAVKVTRGIFAGIAVLVTTFILSALMMLLAILVFIPFMILKLLGIVKSDFKVYKFKP